MKNIFSLLAILLLTACSSTAPASPHGGGAHMMGGEQGKPSRNFKVQDTSSASEVAFSVKEGDAVFSDYGISHTKEMHLVVLRNDLQHFVHLHPKRDAEGVWRIPYSPPAAGRYWLYADFVDSKNESFTLRFERRYAGEPGMMGLTKDPAMEKNVDVYRIALKAEPRESDVSFTYTIVDAEGKHPALDEYLGAKGHSVLLSPSGDFIHTHPSDTSDSPTFTTPLPPDPFYRIFTQFQIAGKVITVSFDWGQGAIGD